MHDDHIYAFFGDHLYSRGRLPSKPSVIISLTFPSEASLDKLGVEGIGRTPWEFLSPEDVGTFKYAKLQAHSLLQK